MQYSYDVLIVGAGPVGLCLASALSKLNLSVVIIEKQSLSEFASPKVDGRDIALTYLSRKILNDIGAWQHIPSKNISTIREARVFNGNSSKFMGLSSSQTDPLAFIVSNHLIRSSIYEIVKTDKNILVIADVSIADLQLNNLNVEAVLTNGKHIKAKLIVAADSRFSETRKKIGIPASMYDFGKTMVLCQMTHDLPHCGVAHECFLNRHTLAVLPLNGNRSSVIITMPPFEAIEMISKDEEEFNEWVSRQFKNRLGKMSLDSNRYSYPLIGVYANNFVKHRAALVGDAAVGMHPVTAHGFNFGLRGINILSKTIHNALRDGLDIGTKDVLINYQHSHQRATRMFYMTTNYIVALYTNDSNHAKMARKILLQIANHMQPIKSFMIAKLTEKDL